MAKGECSECAASFGMFKKKKLCDECDRELCGKCIRKTPKTKFRPKQSKCCTECHTKAVVPTLDDDQLHRAPETQLKLYLSAMKVSFSGDVDSETLVRLVKETVAERGGGASASASSSSSSSQRRRSRTRVEPLREQSRREQPRRARSSAANIPADIFFAEAFLRLLLNAAGDEQPEDEEQLRRDRELQKKRHEEIMRKQENARILENAKSPDEFKDLKVSQLKDILAQNFVDYSQCIEKHELLAKVVALWEERQKEGEPVEEAKCNICFENDVDCVFLECGHLCSCSTCGERLEECPMCRAPITRIVHVFR